MDFAQKGVSQGSHEGAFFKVIPAIIWDLCAKYEVYMIFVRVKP